MGDWEVYNNAGWELYEQELYSEALEVYQIAEEKLNSAVIVDERGIALLSTNMAAAYRALGQYREAKIYYIRSLNAWETLVGKNHKHYATIANNYSMFLLNQRKYTEALKYANEALKTRRKLFGEENESVADTHGILSLIYLNDGQMDKAITHGKLALDSALGAEGSGSELVASSEVSLGMAYRAAEDIDSAIPHIENVLNIYLEIGDNSTRAADAVTEMGLLYNRKEDYASAEDYLTRALEMYRRLYGENHPYIATMYKNIAFNYLEWGKGDEALNAITESVSINASQLGANHVETTAARSSCIQISDFFERTSKACYP